jgi:hypothetical protein
MNGVFGIAGGFAFAAAFVFCAAINAARWHDMRRFWQRLFGGIALAVGFSATLWIGIEYPGANFWRGQGFGPDWECRNLGRGGAQVCFPDKPSFGR